MIDLHCHLLPGIDDGPGTIEEATRLALAARERGITTAVATPHLNHSYRPSIDEIDEAAQALRDSLAAERCDLEILTGAEIAVDRLGSLDQAGLEARTLGGGTTLLIESPFADAPDHLEFMINDLTVAGFTILLAHPERSGYFHSNPEVLSRLVGRGVLCSLTAMSFAGRFGRGVRKVACAMAAEGIAVNVSSDAHDLSKRIPGLDLGRRPVEGLASQDQRDELARSLIAG